MPSGLKEASEQLRSLWIFTAPAGPDGCRAGRGTASCKAQGFLCQLCPAPLAYVTGSRTRSCTHPARPLLIPARDSEGCLGQVMVLPSAIRWVGSTGTRCTPGCVSASHPQLLSPKPPGSAVCYVSAFPLCKAQKPREMKR